MRALKIAILGAGISGLSLFDILDRQYNIKCDIYEKEEEIGGLCRTRIVNGYTYDISGGHVFNSKNEKVKEYVFDLLKPDEWVFSSRNAKILFDNGLVIDYPFEFSLSKLPFETAFECIRDLFLRKDMEIKNLEDFFIYNFGNGIYKYYLKPYNEKIWKMDLHEMDFDWIHGKIPYPSVEDIVRKILECDTSENSMVHSTFYYPIDGGINTLVNRIGKDVAREHIGEDVEKIEFVNSKIYVNGNKYDLVVNTIPLPELANKVQNLPKDIENALNNLKYNSLLTYIFPTERENNWSWCYLPDKKIIPHRMMYQGNLSIKCAPEGKSSVTTEITNPIDDEKIILENVKNYLGLDNPIDRHFTKYAYVVFDKNRRKNLDVIRSFLSNFNFILHGRFAEWDYPNMDICIERSLLLAGKIAEKSGIM